MDIFYFSQTRQRAFYLALLSVALVGCGGSTERQETQSGRLRTVVTLYGMERTVQGRPPASAEDFKKFITERGKASLERSGVASADELLTSDRDGQPYVVIYGKPPTGMNQDVVAFEQTGVDGIRLVGFGLGYVEEVDEAKFKTYVPNLPAAK